MNIQKSKIGALNEEYWKSIDDSYYKTNIADDLRRRKWLAKIIAFYKPKTVLEIGCNEGSNLREIHKQDRRIELYGIDIHENAIHYARQSLPAGHFFCGSIYELDQYFGQKQFDVVFSMGTLIHIAPEILPWVRDQLVHFAKRVIIHCEEHSEAPGPKRWRGGIPHRWAHDYSALYQGLTAKIHKSVVCSAGGRTSW